jgi:hypothetical protein
MGVEDDELLGVEEVCVDALPRPAPRRLRG